jgi:hypothetical protein
VGRTLTLTSPLTQGTDVTFSQECLQGKHGPYVAFYKGALHGIYDEATAAAAKQAKYYLGFPLVSVDQSCGDTLRGLLQADPSKLPEDYQVRRGYRLHPPAIHIRLRALATAVSQIGVKESPAGSNNVLYSRWYGIAGSPWCAAFVTWCFEQHDSVAFVQGERYAYCPYVVADARAGRYGLSVVTTPIAGDLALYDWNKDGIADHIGIVEAGNASSFHAVEGNTAVGNDSAGGEVMRRDRSGSDVQCFVRVNA